MIKYYYSSHFIVFITTFKSIVEYVSDTREVWGPYSTVRVSHPRGQKPVLYVAGTHPGVLRPH